MPDLDLWKQKIWQLFALKCPLSLMPVCCWNGAKKDICSPPKRHTFLFNAKFRLSKYIHSSWNWNQQQRRHTRARVWMAKKLMFQAHCLSRSNFFSFYLFISFYRKWKQKNNSIWNNNIWFSIDQVYSVSKQIRC